MTLPDQTAYPRDPKIELEMSEPVARYVLALLDVDGYEHSPNDYETAELRRSIERQLSRAQQQALQTGGRAMLSNEHILTVIEQLHACYDYCAAWKEPAQRDDRVDDNKTQR